MAGTYGPKAVSLGYYIRVCTTVPLGIGTIDLGLKVYIFFQDLVKSLEKRLYSSQPK